ncbi:MAG: glycosyl hydrolase family 28-related protein [Acutalibacteraceae bacterium]|jgi:hypothetical protein
MNRSKRAAALLSGLLLAAGMLALPGCKPPVYAEAAGNVAMVSPSDGMQSSDEIVYNINAVDMGADPTGNEDATEVIQTCLNTLENVGGVVFLPAGQYKVEGTLRVPSAVTLRGEWRSPDDKGLGKGTILMAYEGRGTENPEHHPFIDLSGASVLRDISVWYPEQVAADVQPYPATICGHGHTAVLNVTLYNSYTGFYNPGCSSMMIRGLYGTVLNLGIYGADAYDIPRIERVRFSPDYWIGSGLKNAPVGAAIDELKEYTRQHLIGIKGGQMDWGYWYDLQMTTCKYGVLLVHGNDAIGNIKVSDADVGIYIDNMSYPGLEVSYGDFDTTVAGIFYDEIGSDDPAAKGTYFGRNTLAVSASTFRGKGYGIQSIESNEYGINLNDCVFEDWGEYALSMPGGHLVISNSEFKADKTPLRLDFDVDEAVLVGNSFKHKGIVDGDGWSDDDSRFIRDDGCREIPHTPEYAHDFVPDNKPQGHRLFNVDDFGAVCGHVRAIPGEDSTGAIQKALDAAKEAGGGTVYLSGGVYRVEGSLSVPEGVELRGCYDGPHYGNSTWVGTQIYAYGGKDQPDGAPLIALEKNAGVRGFTVFYPEQGYSDKGVLDGEMVVKYPATIQANEGTWIQNMAIVGSWRAIDAITNRCDGIVIYDVTGASMSTTLELGHGTDGGVVQNLHFNYSGWTQQGMYENQPDGDRVTADGHTTRNDLLNEYTSRVTKGMILGDVKNVDFFSCFNIIVNTQISLVKDSYTGKSANGTMWGVAFDAAQHGIVAEDGCDADLTLINSMGVFNQQGGGYNVVTKPGFTGTVRMFNQDAWGSNSKLAYVEGGTVDLVQYFSWCAYEAECFEGGTLNLLGSTIVSNNGDGSGEVFDAWYHNGAKGQVIGNLDCDQRLHIEIDEGAKVDKRLNGEEYVALW